MNFRIEHKCPQCDAPLDLTETDRLLTCPYCGVRNLIVSAEPCRFVLPARKAAAEICCYAPYLRFKGAVYTVSHLDISHRLVDLTQRGVALEQLPISLGLRPQAMKLRFVNQQTEGRFLKNTLTVARMLSRAAASPADRDKNPQFQAHIGETVNYIYLPLHLSGEEALDGITGNPILARQNLEDELIPLLDGNPAWQPTFVPAICPECGWNLDGERDSIVLFCHNCNTVWQEANTRFSRLDCQVVTDGGQHSIFLPFWHITAVADGREAIASFGDFIRLTNQPLVVSKAMEAEAMTYLVPAFKIQPKDFLRLAGHLTMSLRRGANSDVLPRQNLHPVTLPVSEAIQSLPLVLAGLTIPRINVLPYLQDFAFDVMRVSLLLLPFDQTSHELQHRQLCLVVNKNGLRWGRNL
jgi:DNA-directed RNA polymerase subunit RPC12/RpoP